MADMAWMGERIAALEAGIANAATDLREIEPCSRGDEHLWIRRANLSPIVQALDALLADATATQGGAE